MIYFKIGEYDFSKCINSLEVSTAANYSALTNAAGNTVIDWISEKRTFTVGFIPLNEVDMVDLQTAIAGSSVELTVINPATATTETVNCFIPDNTVSYYTIQPKKVLFHPFTLTFTEL